MNIWFLILFGIILVTIGFMLIIIGSIQKKEKRETPQAFSNHTKIKGGGVIMIGPIPIIFGSDYKYAIIAILLAIILMVMVILFIS